MPGRADWADATSVTVPLVTCRVWVGPVVVNRYAPAAPRTRKAGSETVSVNEPLATLPARSVAVTPTAVSPSAKVDPLGGEYVTITAFASATPAGAKLIIEPVESVASKAWLARVRRGAVAS